MFAVVGGTISGLLKDHDRDVTPIWVVINYLGCEEKCHNAVL